MKKPNTLMATILAALFFGFYSNSIEVAGGVFYAPSAIHIMIFDSHEKK